MPRCVPTALFVAPLILAVACSDGATAPGTRPDADVGAVPGLSSAVGVGTPYVNGAPSALCLDVNGNQSAAGTPLILWTCHGRANQRFTLNAAGELRAMNDAMCVDASGGAGRAGDQIIIWTCHGGRNQHWVPTAANQLQGINGLCIAPVRDATAPGARLALAACTAAATQTWAATAASPAPALPATSAATLPVPADSFVNSIGVNLHLSWFDRIYYTGFSTVVVPKLRALGVRHLRDGGPVVPNDGWMTAAYAHYRTLAEVTGAKFTIIVSPANTAAGPGDNYTDASHIRAVLRYTGADNVEAFEGLNEHDQSGRPGWASEVVSMQRALWTTVKSDPALAARYAILGPTVTSSGAVTTLGQLAQYMDAAAFHPYPGAGTPSSAIGFNLSKYAPLIAGRAPYATETGYPTSMRSPRTGFQPVPEAVAAKYLPRLFLENFNAGIARSFSYELIDQGTDQSDPEQGFGLVRVDGAEKPAYSALRNLITLLSDPGAPFTPSRIQYGLAGDTAGVHKTVLQKRDGRTYLVFWQEATSYDPTSRAEIAVAAKAVTLQLARPARAISVYSPLTSATATDQVSTASQIVVRIPDHPIVVEIAP